MVVMNDSTNTTARIGVATGRMILKKVCAWLAPSTLADSSSSFGMVSKKPLMSQALMPMAPPRYTRPSPSSVPRPIAGITSPIFCTRM